MIIKKRTRIRTLFFCVILTALFFAFCNLPAAFAKEKPIKLKFAYWMPTKHTLHKVFDRYAKEAKAVTNGRVQITLYPGGALGKPKDQWDMALGGIADLSFFMPGFTPGRFPRSSVFDLPNLLGGSATVNTAIAQGVYDEYIAPDFKDAKMMLFFVCEPFTIHTSKKKVQSMADLKGLKIRSSGTVQSDMIKALGGSPVTMPITEVYTSLEKGVLDGVVTAYTAMVSFRLYDVSKYSIMAGLTATPMCVAMNKKRWNSLPDGIKAILDKLNRKYNFESVLSYDEDRVRAIQKGKTLGKDIYSLPTATLEKWNENFVPVYDQWVKDMKAKGLPNQELIDKIRQLQGK